MNEKALLNRAKLIEKAFELSLSKVPRHSSHTEPFFGVTDFNLKRETTKDCDDYDKEKFAV